MFCTQPTISSSLIVHSTNIFLTIKLGTFLIFYQTLLLHLSVYTGGSVGGAPNAQKAFVQTVLGFCMAPYYLLYLGCFKKHYKFVLRS